MGIPDSTGLDVGRHLNQYQINRARWPSDLGFIPNATRKRPPEGGLTAARRGLDVTTTLQTTLAIAWQTWSMFLLLSAATHMRPVSVP